MNASAGHVQQTHHQAQRQHGHNQFRLQDGRDADKPTHAVTRFTADTAYRTEVDTRMEPPMPGRGEMKITQDGKWVGPCPADMHTRRCDDGQRCKNERQADAWWKQ